ncbi:NADPH-dependent oxidoreductase [Lactiplantibacillus herbarum]|uniref:NADPH-dependent oxidoreductase n=1 Tax=Lactiplantibacillus herbarum TaxID=1670446 RepID=UPI00064EF24A|nr:NADPH-dependent oxidoreductase [Lactiplantibacillus herbarum]
MTHRTIRQFTDQPIGKPILQQLITAAQNTATSHFLQSFSIIHITDHRLRQQIAGISKQSYIDGNGELLIFLVDHHRAALAADQHDTSGLHTADKFIQGASDTLLAAQNLVATAESMDLGTVILGSILNDPMQLIKLLNLPPLVFPICGVIVGYPDQQPQLKPRMPQDLMSFENTYQLPEDWQNQWDSYDDVIREYYAMRDTNKRVESFTHLLTNGAGTTPTKRGELLAALQRQGFLLK